MTVLTFCLLFDCRTAKIKITELLLMKYVKGNFQHFNLNTLPNYTHTHTLGEYIYYPTNSTHQGVIYVSTIILPNY